MNILKHIADTLYFILGLIIIAFQSITLTTTFIAILFVFTPWPISVPILAYMAYINFFRGHTS